MTNSTKSLLDDNLSEIERKTANAEFVTFAEVKTLCDAVRELRYAIGELRHELRVHARTKPFNKAAYISGRKRADELLARTKELEWLPSPPQEAKDGQ